MAAEGEGSDRDPVRGVVHVRLDEEGPDVTIVVPGEDVPRMVVRLPRDELGSALGVLRDELVARGVVQRCASCGTSLPSVIHGWPIGTRRYGTTWDRGRAPRHRHDRPVAEIAVEDAEALRTAPGVLAWGPLGDPVA